MNDANIQKIADLINKNIREGEMRYDIQNPFYQAVYFDIFFADIAAGGPTPYDSLYEKLIDLIDQNESRSEEAMESFMTVWNAWVALYLELQKRDKL